MRQASTAVESMAQATTLKLDRGLSNTAFGSWHLDSSADLQPERHQLPGHVATVLAGGEGFLQTKTVLQQNHLHEQPCGTYVFLCRPLQQLPALHRVEYKDGAPGVATTQLTAQLDGKEEAEATGGLLEPRLPASMAEVRSSGATGSRSTANRLLVSSGYGDLRLVSEEGVAVGSIEIPPICPLRATPPQQGVRTFLIEAAYETPGGKLQCIVSALRSKRDGTPAACEVFAITLAPPASEAAEPLHVDDVQLLETSASRPYAVVPAPEQQMVLLAVDPKLPKAGAAAVGAASAAEEFDANPRSMQQAVDNLARFTSDKPAEGPLSERLADIDSETGPGGEGGLGGEPEVALVLLSLGGTADSAAAFTEVERMACGAHRLLGTSSSGSSGSVLLGLTDDVDAAVVRAGISIDGRIAAEHVATVPALAYVAAGKVQRRAVLFGQPGSVAAAVIVEAHAYAYVYKAVAPKEMTGKNLIIPLRLGTETMGVLGMRILAVSGGSGGSRAMLLTEDAVITVSL